VVGAAAHVNRFRRGDPCGRPFPRIANPPGDRKGRPYKIQTHRQTPICKWDGRKAVPNRADFAPTMPPRYYSRCGTLAAGSLSPATAPTNIRGCAPPWFVGIRSGLSSPARGLRAIIHAAARSRPPRYYSRCGGCATRGFPSSRDTNSRAMPVLVCIPRSGPSALLRTPPRYYSRCGGCATRGFPSSRDTNSRAIPVLVCIPRSGPSALLRTPPRYNEKSRLFHRRLSRVCRPQASLFSLMVMLLFLLAALFLCSRPLAAALSTALTATL